MTTNKTIREIPVKCAKPSEENWDAAFAFVAGIEGYVTYGFDPDGDDDGELIDDEQFVEWLTTKWLGRRQLRLEHCLWAGKTAIDNACDPAADVLELKPELAKPAETLSHWRDEIEATLSQLDGLAEVWGDEGVFRRCRDRLRKLLEDA